MEVDSNQSTKKKDVKTEDEIIYSRQTNLQKFSFITTTTMDENDNKLKKLV